MRLEEKRGKDMEDVPIEDSPNKTILPDH